VTEWIASAIASLLCAANRVAILRAMAELAWEACPRVRQAVQAG
jgi:hypothetical protein